MKQFMRYLFVAVLSLGVSVSSYALTTFSLNGTGSNRNTQEFAVDDSGNVTANGTVTAAATSLSGSETIAGNSTITGNISVSGKVIYPRTTITGVFGSTTVIPTSEFYVLTSSSPGGTIPMTSTPTLSTTTATDGQFVVLKGTSSVATITLQDNGTLAGSLLELGSTTRIISDLKVITLMFDSLVGKWIEVSYGNN